jgi:hypothetical protein
MRRSLSAMVICLTIAAVGFAQQEHDQVKQDNGGNAMQPFKLQITQHLAGDSRQVVSVLFLHDKYAIEMHPIRKSKVVAVYDLENLWWQDSQPGRIVRMKDCEYWTRSAAELWRNLAAQTLERFVELSLAPKFEISEGDDELTLSNEIMTYRVSRPMQLDELQLKRFFTHHRLRTYREAMGKRMPPCAQLAVIDELARRQFAPGKVEREFRTLVGGHQITSVSFAVEDVSDSEAEQATEAIRAAQAMGDGPFFLLSTVDGEASRR